MSSEAVNLVIKTSYEPTYGARPIRRFLEKHLVTELSRMIISGQLKEHSTVTIAADKGKLCYSVMVREVPKDTDVDM